MADKHLKYWLVAPALAIMALTLLYPLVAGFWYSLHSWNIAQQATLGPYVGLDNYRLVLTDDPDFWGSVRVTGIFTLFSVVITMVLAMSLALLLSGNDGLTVNVRTLLVLPFSMSPALLGISWRFLLNPEFGAISAGLGAIIPALKGVPMLADPTLAMAALIASDVWHWSPYFMLLFVGALAALPQETIEAAQVDGASRFRVFWEITLPQLRPVLTIAILLKAIFSLKVLDQVVTLTAGGPGTATETLAHFVYLTAFRFYDLGYSAAIAYLLAAVMGVLAVLYTRFVMERA
ncbi:ABC transporter permease subunit [Rhizobium lusitanum]|uniref:ABC transporter permease subunit n=1 Tax=Rhizobium lusitanum TaxID=293958 RepID=A0A6L9UHU2_9HYPH|nr:sugar ABC transporter permease [Rhizobium lusitanum]NEI74949.1 ABC transporter permease subunit [Rhizobium lusitanum]